MKATLEQTQVEGTADFEKIKLIAGISSISHQLCADEAAENMTRVEAVGGDIHIAVQHLRVYPESLAGYDA